MRWDVCYSPLKKKIVISVLAVDPLFFSPLFPSLAVEAIKAKRQEKNVERKRDNSHHEPLVGFSTTPRILLNLTLRFEVAFTSDLQKWPHSHPPLSMSLRIPLFFNQSTDRSSVVILMGHGVGGSWLQRNCFQCQSDKLTRKEKLKQTQCFLPPARRWSSCFERRYTSSFQPSKLFTRTGRRERRERTPSQPLDPASPSAVKVVDQSACVIFSAT